MGIKIDEFQSILGLGIANMYAKRTATFEEEPFFRFTVVTTVPDETFGLPLELTGNYDFNANWGDGSDSDITVWNHADTIHKYATPGTHEISITGTITGWRFNNGGNCALFYELKSWGPLRLRNSSGYFYGCVNMTVTATDVLDLTGMTNASGFFRECDSIITIPSINSWDWSNIVNITSGFYSMAVFNQDLSGLATAPFENISYAFTNSLNFDQDLSSWGVSSLVNANSFLLNVTLSVANYNALILSWSPQVPSGVYNFHGGNSKYTGGGAVEAARDAWIAKSWILTDAGIA